jgi:serine/threonine protein phosphatase PrpC
MPMPMHLSRVAHAVAIAPARGLGQDRARVFDADGDVIVALADGAGGTAHGATAAQAVVDAVGAAATATHDWCALLSDLDRDLQRLGRGQSTAVILSIRAGSISGASVGDSGAWLVRTADVIDLTERQQRKPLVGGGCTPFRIQPVHLDISTLLVASDGLFAYAKRSDILRIVRDPDLHSAAHALTDLVRLPDGALQDDVAVVLCRARPRQRC